MVRWGGSVRGGIRLLLSLTFLEEEPDQEDFQDDNAQNDTYVSHVEDCPNVATRWDQLDEVGDVTIGNPIHHVAQAASNKQPNTDVQ